MLRQRGQIARCSPARAFLQLTVGEDVPIPLEDPAISALRTDPGEFVVDPARPEVEPESPAIQDDLCQIGIDLTEPGDHLVDLRQHSLQYWHDLAFKRLLIDGIHLDRELVRCTAVQIAIELHAAFIVSMVVRLVEALKSQFGEIVHRRLQGSFMKPLTERWMREHIQGLELSPEPIHI